MCGRFVNAETDDAVEYFDIRETISRLFVSWDVRPTTRIGIIIDHAGTGIARPIRQLRAARWGLIPSWSKTADPKLRLINARAETVLSKPSFCTAARQRRAIVPAQGYYEWAQNPDGTKTPYFLHDPTQPILGFAGLYEYWRVPDSQTMPGTEEGWLCTATIITRAATDALGHIHDRMPLIVPRDTTDQWLDPATTNTDQIDAIIHAIPDSTLVPVERQPG